MKINVRNVVFDADGMKILWRKYIEKHLNVENDWDDEIDCPEVMWPCCPSEEEVATAIKGLQIGKAAGPTGVVSEMMKASGDVGTRLMTDLTNNIVKEGCCCCSPYVLFRLSPGFHRSDCINVVV